MPALDRVPDEGALADALWALHDALVAVLSPIAANMVDPSTGLSYQDAIQVLIGWPTAEDLGQILNAKESQISIWPTGASHDTSRFNSSWRPQKATSPLVATVALGNPSTITFSGSVVAGLNIHAHVGKPNATRDAYYQTIGSDGLNSIATAVAARISALGFSATAAGPQVSVPNVTALTCHIGAVGTLTREVARTDEQVQIAVWTPFPHWRAKYSGAIKRAIGAIGDEDSQWLTFGSNGAAAWLRYRGQVWKDRSQNEYGLYEAHLLYMMEYPEIATLPGYPVGAIQPSLSQAGALSIGDVG